VPFLIWTDSTYRAEHPQRVELLASRTAEPIQTDCVFPTMLGLGGIVTPYGQDSLALTSEKYITKEKRTYLSDHNKALTFDRCLGKTDFKAMEKRGLRTY
jgi:glucan phosphoethanolaminetransferase (alkaline phosphatase superfamily)